VRNQSRKIKCRNQVLNQRTIISTSMQREKMFLIVFWRNPPSEWGVEREISVMSRRTRQVAQADRVKSSFPNQMRPTPPKSRDVTSRRIGRDKMSGA
jgi:hypothetical protein